MKHTIMCKCGKLAIKCKWASEALKFIINIAKKEVFDDLDELYGDKPLYIQVKAKTS